MENLKIELQKFDHERFNQHYRALINIGQTAGELEYEMLDALHFIASCESIIEQIKEAIEKLPDETHCQHCDDNEKLLDLQNETLENKDEAIGLLKEELEKFKKKCRELTDENIGLYKKLEAATKKEAEVFNK